MLVEAWPGNKPGTVHIYTPALPGRHPAECYHIEAGDWRYLKRLLRRSINLAWDDSGGARPAVRQIKHVCDGAAWDLLAPAGEESGAG